MQAAAQAARLEVTRVGPATISPDTGGRITPPFRVINRASASVTGRVIVALPASWRSLVLDTSIVVAARDSEFAYLAIWIPPDARAGATVVRYGVSAPTAASTTDSVVVVVPERRSLSVRPFPVPRFVAAGTAYTTRFTVRNVGNARTSVRLRLASSGGVEARLVDSSRIVLEPGESHISRVEVRTSQGLTEGVHHQVVLTATSDNQGVTVSDKGTTIVEIVPRRAGSAPRFRSLPGELLLRGGDKSNTYSAELHGSGALNGGSTRADFLFRGPNPTNSFLGQQDEFRFGLFSPHYQLQLGDAISSASRLTETGLSAFGASAGIPIGPLVASAYTKRDRRSYAYTGEQQTGGSADVWLSSFARIGGSAFTRTGVNATSAWSARGTLAALGTRIDGELGHDLGTRGGMAYATAFSAQYSRISLDLRRESADSAFRNYWHGSTTTSAYTAFRPFAPLSINIRYSEFSSGGAGPVAFSINRNDRGAEAGITLGNILGTTYRSVYENGLSFAPGASRQTQSVQAFFGIPLPGLFIRLEDERGGGAFAGSSGGKPFERVGVRASLNAFGQRISAGGQKTTGTPPYSAATQNTLSGNASASIRLGGSTRLTMSATAFRYGAAQPVTFTTLDVGLSHSLAAGRRVAAHSRSFAYSPAIATQRSMGELEYALPLGIPVALSEDAGSVDVTVIDDATRRPVRDVLVRLANESRFTDAAGRAKFVGLSEGTYYLETDRGSLLPGRIVMPATPMSVSLRPREKRLIELHVMPGVRVAGSVMRQQFRVRPRIDAPDSLVDAAPATNVVIGMANGDTVRVPIDADGRFSFTDLHPGKWTLFIVTADLPAGHHLDRQRVALDLVPGTMPSIDIKIVPENRNVTFITSAELKPTLVSGDSMPAAPRPVSRHTYTVGNDRETLFQIAGAMYGARGLWPKIWMANRDLLPTPESLRRGQTLVVPDSAALTPDEIAARDDYLAGRGFAPPGGAAPVRRPPVGTRFHTVVKGDGLMALARALYDDESLWPKIWYANLDLLPTTPDLKIGQRLRIPDKAPLTERELALWNRYRGRKP